jgi:hypothetical protein
MQSRLQRIKEKQIFKEKQVLRYFQPESKKEIEQKIKIYEQMNEELQRQRRS